jgi:hypothetical protein
MTFCECVNKKLVYPKTYDECCEIIHSDPNFYIDTHLYSSILETLYKLLICHYAYCKIAGVEMGLGKPWEPDWSSFSEGSYPTITKCNGRIVKTSIYTHDCLLAFPTEELRNIFYENFKDLIEKCKELL